MIAALFSPRILPLVLLAVSGATLGAALLFQYAGGYAPCVLCHYQRWPHIAVIALAALAFLIWRRRATGQPAGFVFVCAATLLAGLGVSLYHVGVEQGVFAGPTSCSNVVAGALSVEELRERLTAAPIVRCDEVVWSLLGLSMAAWNALICFALAGYAIIMALRKILGANRHAA
jgi:disulfide bond formation protein DsbB